MAKVNVYTCAYNAEKTIARTIESVLAQTYQDYLYIIIDNASTDGTLNIIREYAALSDGKIKVCQLFQNDIRHYTSIMVLANKLTLKSTSFFTHIDADDEMHPAFLERMVAFAQEYDLDFVGAGYEKVDGATGCVISQRAMKENIVLTSPKDFKEKFIEYRGLTTFSWGKLYRLREKEAVLADYKMYEDSVSTLKYLQRAERAGFVKDVLFRYYVYKSSYSYQRVDLAVQDYELLYHRTREFIESYGRPSALNRDFLYAIYLSIMQDTIDWVLFSETAPPQKLAWCLEILNKPLAAEVFALQSFSPEIRNLQNRNDILDKIEGKLAAVPDAEHTFAKIQERMRELKCVTA